MSSSTQVPDRRIPWPAAYEPATAVVFAQNTVEIAAPLEAAWSLLIDCARWPAWYRHCSDVSIQTGGPQLGPGSKFRFKTLGLYFEPQVEVFEPLRILIWSARGPAGSRGAHAWRLEPTPTGCRVVTEEGQWGWLLRIVGARTRRSLLTYHEEWLRALKALAEAGAAPERDPR